MTPSSSQPVYSPANLILRAFLVVVIAAFAIVSRIFSRLYPRQVLAESRHSGTAPYIKGVPSL